MKTVSILAAALAAATALTGVSAQTAAKPAMAATAAKPAAAKPAKAAAAPTGKTATATLKNGKKVTYDCSKKGNAAKKACKA